MHTNLRRRLDKLEQRMPRPVEAELDAVIDVFGKTGEFMCPDGSPVPEHVIEELWRQYNNEPAVPVRGRTNSYR